MKVRDLIELLKKESQDAIVLVSSDEEGNHYSPFDTFARGNFDDGNGTCYGMKNWIYSMTESEVHGDYIILYPR